MSWGILEYLGDLDLADEWRLTRRWVRVWIVESSSVWGDIRSVVEMECVWNLETRIFRQRGWNSGVSPNTYHMMASPKVVQKKDDVILPYLDM